MVLALRARPFQNVIWKPLDAMPRLCLMRRSSKEKRITISRDQSHLATVIRCAGRTQAYLRNDALRAGCEAGSSDGHLTAARRC